MSPRQSDRGPIPDPVLDAIAGLRDDMRASPDLAKRVIALEEASIRFAKIIDGNGTGQSLAVRVDRLERARYDELEARVKTLEAARLEMRGGTRTIERVLLIAAWVLTTAIAIYAARK